MCAYLLVCRGSMGHQAKILDLSMNIEVEDPALDGIRPLQDSEVEQLSSIEGVRSIKMLSHLGSNQDKGTAEYLVTLNLSADHVNQDAVIGAILRCVLDMGVTPRRLAEGRSLESHFLEVTGGQSGDAVILDSAYD